MSVRGAALLLTAAVVLASRSLLAAPAVEECSGSDVADLPLVMLDAPREMTSPARVAILLTGDGGWRRLDVRVSERLRERGIAVVGFLTPSYYRKAKSPEVASCALARLMRAEMECWGVKRVLLIGYSRGADVLPFMISRLPDDLRAAIDVVALLGVERTIEFRYDPAWNPFDPPHEPQFPVLPEVEKLRGQRVLCVYGTKETDTICRGIDPSLAKAVSFSGAHHFGGNYKAIADAIVAAVEGSGTSDQ